MLPHEREMVKRLEGKPFTLLGLNSDQSRSALKDILKKESITWPNIWQGTPGAPGSISQQWNVTGWPTIYVLDHEGVIRHRDLRGPELEEAVMKLVEKAPPRAGSSAPTTGPVKP